MRTELAREFVPGLDQAACREVEGALLSRPGYLAPVESHLLGPTCLEGF